MKPNKFSLHVAIDERPLTGADAIRGIGFHTRELIGELTKINELNIDIFDFNKNASQLYSNHYDIIHYQYFHPHFLTLPFKKPNGRVIVTIHDLIRLIYLNSYPPGVKGRLKYEIQRFNLKNVDAVLTISETSKKDIVRFLRIDPSKIHVVYLAPQGMTYITGKSIAETKKRYKLPSKFVLYVGDVNYNKNLLNLAEGCKLAQLPLVIVGKQSIIEDVDNNLENASWHTFLEKYKNDSSIIRLGFLKNEEFEAVFSLASLYCQASFYEGFGLPILEAFQRGLPVVAAKTQALVEVGGNACIYVDPHLPHEIAKGISKVAKDRKLARELILKGKERVKNFTWEKTAKETYEVYKKVTKV